MCEKTSARSGLGVLLLLWAVSVASAGTRADLSGDRAVQFQTTMNMPMMSVHNVGNAGDSGIMNDGTTGYGSVGYRYWIGKFEVTAGQYTEFLNAVGADDTYGLYTEGMRPGAPFYPCGIQRFGSPGSYTYSVEADREDRPVNLVDWGDTARYCNWLTNGMPTGAQSLATTEDGSYFLNGATSESSLLAVIRKGPEEGGRYYIPTEDEWHKAAYHKNDGVTGNYFDYPTSSDDTPSNVVSDPDPGNNANFYDGSPGGTDFAIGDPYYQTEVGEYENSASPYGTYDMGGNVWEWNESNRIDNNNVSFGIRGGELQVSSYHMFAEYRAWGPPTDENFRYGFRVVEVPEPATMGLLALGGIALLRRRKK